MIAESTATAKRSEAQLEDEADALDRQAAAAAQPGLVDRRQAEQQQQSDAAGCDQDPPTRPKAG